MSSIDTIIRYDYYGNTQDESYGPGREVQPGLRAAEQYSPTSGPSGPLPVQLYNSTTSGTLNPVYPDWMPPNTSEQQAQGYPNLRMTGRADGIADSYSRSGAWHPAGSDYGSQASATRAGTSAGSAYPDQSAAQRQQGSNNSVMRTNDVSASLSITEQSPGLGLELLPGLTLPSTSGPSKKGSAGLSRGRVRAFEEVDDWE
jgi:hypothetical protein